MRNGTKRFLTSTCNAITNSLNWKTSSYLMSLFQGGRGSEEVNLIKYISKYHMWISLWDNLTHDPLRFNGKISR